MKRLIAALIALLLLYTAAEGYFGLPGLHIRLSPYWAAVIGFMLCSGAYQSEYVRGAFLSIKRGQYLGALALGFGHWQTLRAVILSEAKDLQQMA